MLTNPLNNGDFYETHVTYRLALIHFTAVQTDYLSSVVLKLSKVIFAEFFILPAKI